MLKILERHVIQKEIEYDIAPFGKYPYGRELFGILHTENTDGCTNFSLNTFTEEFPPILMLKEGGCNIKQKATNAEHAGAEMLIIIRDEKTTHHELSSKIHDLINIVVDIPTLTISQNTGDQLNKIMRTKGQILLKFQMPIPSSNEVKFEIFFKQDSQKMLSFIHSIKNYIEQFEDKVDIKFHLIDQTIGTNKDRASIQVMLNCLDRDDVYDIVGLYKTDCIDDQNYTSSCFENIISALSSNARNKAKQCIQANLWEITKIQQNMKNFTGTHIMINGMTYHGTIKPEFVFEAICGAFNQSPKSCLFLNNNYSVFLNYDDYKRSSKQYKFTMRMINFIILVVLIVIAGIAIFLVYEKMYDRFLGENIQKIVRDSMSNYESIKNNE